MGENSWNDVMMALQSLGYSPQEIARAKKAISKEEHLNLEELFKKALVFLANKS
jgi:Holliday junction resolvasome RuvABC DNA-binding subunit